MPRVPDPIGDITRFDPRHDPDADRASCMIDVDFGPWTLLDDKVADPYSPGTRGDETGIAADIIRRETRR